MSNRLPDVQNEKSSKEIKIDWVGIRDYKIPFQVRKKDGSVLGTVGKISISSSLSEKLKGANMSRFAQVIEKAMEKNLIDTEMIADMLIACKDKLESEDSYIVVNFPYFIKKKAPVTDHYSHFNIPCSFCGVLKDGKIKMFLEVEINYTSLCPCSKRMSKFSAHNQKSVAKIRLKFKSQKEYLWIEDLVKIVEEVSSCPIFGILKREDEKYVTDKMYENPMFVEDMIREISVKLDEIECIEGYKATVEHFESIHQHNAIAKIKKNL